MYQQLGSIGLGINSSPIGMTANPPYVRFETRAVEKRKLVEEGGQVYSVDIDFALVTSHGSKDTVVKIVVDWFSQLKEEVRQGRFPPQWLETYEASYRAWKNDQELPVAGTALKNWPVATPAEIKNCSNFGIRAVEDLANANEELISRLGMGGRALCNRAKDWVQAGSGDKAALVKQLDSDRHIIIGLQSQIASLTEKVANLSLQLKSQPMTPHVASMAPLENRLQEARDSISEVNDDDVIGGVLKEALGKED